MLADLRAELKGEVDDVWAERVRHLPMSGADADPDRPRLEFSAPLRTEGRDAHRLDERTSRGSRASVMAGAGVLRIDREAHPDVFPRQGDKVVALDRPGEPIFEILSVDDRSHLRLICELGETN